MNKQIIFCTALIMSLFGCKTNCDDEPNANCQGMYVFRDGKCQCPKNSVDMGRSFCKPYSENNFWIQEGNPCLGQAYLFFGDTGTDIFDENKTNIHIERTVGDGGPRISGEYSILKTPNYYIIESKFHDVGFDIREFQECVGNEYEYYDFEIKIDLDWTTARVTYKFWNDIDTSRFIKKEYGTELKALFKNNTGPKPL